MKASKPQEDAKNSGNDHRRNRRRPPTNLDFARLVLLTRENAGLKQAELAEAAGVSRRTVIQVEEQGSSRADIIIRIAGALGQKVEEWLELAGHDVSGERIRAVLNQRQRDKATPPYSRLDPIYEFERMLDRLKKHKSALMCNFVTSQVPIDRPDVFNMFVEMFKHNLTLALICPFPIAERNISLKRGRLNEYYAGAYKWALLLAGQLRERLPEYRHRIAVFSPAFKDYAILVAPPIRVSEVRPAFIKYGSGSDEFSQFELGAYLRFLDGRADQWIEIYGGNGDRSERIEEAFGAWHDYCADIIDSWKPTDAESSFDDAKLAFWERTDLGR
jgi:transcriptional regulator with XRE-family HTH domain